MSFNVRCIGGPEDVPAWGRRRDSVAQVIGSSGADLAGLQEPVTTQIDDLMARLPGYEWVGAGRLDGVEAGEFTPIFYRRERFQVLEQGTFWLSGRPQESGSVGWDASCVRIVTWGRLRDHLTGRVFFHFNTHFDHSGERARLESARLLLGAVAGRAGGYPVVVTGDLNCEEASEPYRLLTGEGYGANAGSPVLRDARHAALKGHSGPELTFNAFAGAGGLSARIDYVLVANGVTVLRHEILFPSEGGSFPSDHLPVIAEVVME